MAKENEVAILDINRKQVIRRLHELKARHVGVYRFKRIEFLLKGDVNGSHSWARVRTDGKETTVTVKETQGKGGFTSTNEHEIKTDNFRETIRIITKLIDPKLIIYFENERDAYLLGNAYITIDKWPRIPAFVEIEAPLMKNVRATYKLLGIQGMFVGNAPIHDIYKLYGLDFRKVMAENRGKLKALLTR